MRLLACVLLEKYLAVSAHHTSDSILFPRAIFRCLLVRASIKLMSVISRMLPTAAAVNMQVDHVCVILIFIIFLFLVDARQIAGRRPKADHLAFL